MTGRVLLACVVTAIVGVASERPQEPGDLLLATTTSVRDSRLLQQLLPDFQRQTGIAVRVVAVGSGQAMALGRRGETDVLILHEPAGERAFVSAGYGIEREPLMHNEFVIVGPPGDPARVRAARNAVAAFRAIAGAEARFASRGDRSGTNVKEDTVWGRSGVEPRGAWYLETGQGMGATLQVAHELRAYTLTDIGTFLGHGSPLDLEILVEGDSLLFNPYHVIVANPARFPWVNVEGARQFSAFLRSPGVQVRIGAFRREEFGRPLFVPDAIARPVAAPLP